MRKKKRPGARHNPVATTLRNDSYRPRIVRNVKAYSRKIKHKNGSIQNAPVFLTGTTGR